MTDQARILVVDDEPQLTRVLRTGLKSRGYDVRAAADGLAGFEAFNDWHPDLVITDLAMPNVDGLELCRRLRAVSQVPIIVLSAKGEEKTKVEALDLGADDFVNKPFGVGELMARLRTALRHRMQRAGETPVLRVGGLEMDIVRHHVALDGNEVNLSPKEFDLLAFLVRYAGKVLTHKQILTAVWGPAHEHDTQYLRVYVGQLRQKIEPNPSDPRFLLTEPGIGYRLADV